MESTSVNKMLEKKFITTDDPDYPLVPLMALWKQKCPYCQGFAVAKSCIGVMSRLESHKRKCELESK